MIKVKYKIKEVKPKVFLVEFQDQYDMCMTFLRAQETYESPNPKFRNKEFTIEEFMKWYSNTYGKGNFTYPTDWSGFNVPSYVIEFVLKCVLEKNDYDVVMEDIYYKCSDKATKKYGYGNTGEVKFYLIGALKGNDKTIQHEVAHAYFYLDNDYRKSMTARVKNLSPAFKKKLFSSLEKSGYTKHVFVDEAQAYLSTGLTTELQTKLYSSKLDMNRKPFIDLFKSFYHYDDHK